MDDEEKSQLLLEKGANINTVYQRKRNGKVDQQPFFHMAVENENEKMVKLLLENGVELYLLNPSRETALHYAKRVYSDPLPDKKTHILNNLLHYYNQPNIFPVQPEENQPQQKKRSIKEAMVQSKPNKEKKQRTMEEIVPAQNRRIEEDNEDEG